MTRTTLLLAALALAALAACSGHKAKDEESRKRLAPLCLESRNMFDHSEGDAAEKGIITALQVCAKACDLGDAPSCEMLDGYIGKICSVDENICKNFAALDDMPSLQSRAKAKLGK
jgi:hypothetical protein